MSEKTFDHEAEDDRLSNAVTVAANDRLAADAKVIAALTDGEKADTPMKFCLAAEDYAAAKAEYRAASERYWLARIEYEKPR